MECNGFNSNNYRYFNLDVSKNWSGFSNLSYGKLSENDIIKISQADLAGRLFSTNYWYRVVNNIHDHDVIEYPITENFDLFKYISMQQPIRFKWDGVLSFIYETGECAFINEWLNNKMNSHAPSRRLTADGSIQEENKRVLNMINDEEKITLSKPMSALEDKKNKNEILIAETELQKFEPQAFRFKVDTKFELEYHKDEVWPLTDSAIFMALFNQDFIRLLANSTEILGRDKERIFYEEYQDNIPGTTRRYYQLKDNIKIKNIYEIMSEFSLEHYDCGFQSLVVRVNGGNVGTCKFNRDNFYSDGSVKYFYVDYPDSLNDRIVEKEILKIAYRLPQEKALIIDTENKKADKEQEELNEALKYINKHKKRYSKYCQRNLEHHPLGFVKKERQELGKRLIKTLESQKNNIQ